ncbi:MAG: MBL fold metallo-hydrolase [Candidatus Taylorbacteria bacterium]|nr:MBL fold metallo-hydrolase [Candidatus Taylorbacteria bacterium]
MGQSARLTFCGGVGSVTGANFLLEAAGKKILVDCGLVQGSRFADEENHKSFPYDPSSIDYLLVTHAHIDHIGRIPKLVSEGFRGKILSTPETRALARLMLEDALKLIEEECRTTGALPLYERKDVSAALSLWSDVQYHEILSLAPDVSVYAKDAGHILGSAMYNITIDADERGYEETRINADGEVEGRKMRIVFTGDLGNSPTPILRDTEEITDADYLVMESVYGDRNHEDRDSRRRHLKDVISDTVKRKGTLIIPAFSLEKTQVLLYEFHKFEEAHEIPVVPVFLDSPLAIEVTKVYQAMRDNFNDKAMAEDAREDIFRFPRLKFTAHSEESKAILNVPAPKIILAGAGMSNGGRIMHHEANYLPGSQNTILFVGYQAAGSLGRQIQDGAREVTINGQKVAVHAQVETISGYSSHKDSDHLVEFASRAAESGALRKVFVVMGEPKSALFLVQRLRDYLGIDAVHPSLGERVELA